MLLKAPVNNIPIKPIYLIQGGIVWQTIDTLKKIYSSINNYNSITLNLDDISLPPVRVNWQNQDGNLKSLNSSTATLSVNNEVNNYNLACGIKKYHFINFVQFVQFVQTNSAEIFNKDLFCVNKINKVLEINIGNGKFTKQQLEVLDNFIQNLNSLNNFIVILIADQLIHSSLSASWVNIIKKIGITVITKTLSRDSMYKWSVSQFKLAKLTISEEALNKFVNVYQNDLFAAEQAIYKLTLYIENNVVNEVIDLKKLLKVISDKTKFSVFDLSNAINNSKIEQIVYILNCLRQQGEEKLLILWILTKEIFNNISKKRNLIDVKHSLGDLFNKALEIDRTIKNVSIVDGDHEEYIWSLIVDLSISFLLIAN